MAEVLMKPFWKRADLDLARGRRWWRFRVHVLALGIVLSLGAIQEPAFAHPGNTDSQGGHTCRTNCPQWGLSFGQYHYHNRPSPAPGRTQVEPLPVRARTSNGLSDAVGTFFENGGILVLIGAWWLYSRSKKS